MIARKKFTKRSIATQSARSPTEIGRQVLTTSRIGLVIPADLAGANSSFFAASARQTSFATLARVHDKGSSEARHAHDPIGLQDVFDQETFYIPQPHVFIAVTEENYAVSLLAEDALRFDAECQTINFRLARAVSQHVDRVSLGVQALHDSECAAIDG